MPKKQKKKNCKNVGAYDPNCVQFDILFECAIMFSNFIPFPRYDHPNILAGQGTMGLEIIEQVPDVDAVVIPVGGGGLIAGCAVALKSMNPNIKIIVINNILHKITYSLQIYFVSIK